MGGLTMRARMEARRAPGIPAIEPYPLPAAADLPTRRLPWRLDSDRVVLLVHDMQRYFVAPFPAEMREELVGNVALLRARCASLGVPVAYTAQPGDMTDEERGLLKDVWGPGMRATSADRQVVEGVEPAEGDWVFTKWRYSAFFRSDLLARMRAAGRDQLLVCGVYAHVGVLVSALDAFTNDIQPFVVADAVADFDEPSHRMALDYGAARCAVVLTVEEVFR